MGITYSSVVDAPIGEVFEWHARPGAITRLLPPWQPVRVGQEAGSLRDGRAVLLLPGGVRWVAAHQPDGYNPPHQFVDQLVSAGLSSVVSWRHTHMFSAEGEAEGENETRVSDDVANSGARGGAPPDVRLPAPAARGRPGRPPLGKGAPQ